MQKKPDNNKMTNDNKRQNQPLLNSKIETHIRFGVSAKTKQIRAYARQASASILVTLSYYCTYNRELCGSQQCCNAVVIHPFPFILQNSQFKVPHDGRDSPASCLYVIKIATFRIIDVFRLLLSVLAEFMPAG